MADIYSVIEVVNGIKYTVFFFASFSGHFHPWTPINPLHIDEVGSKGLVEHGKSVYYQAWYSDTSKGPRLDKLIKYSLYRGPIDVDIKLTNIPGVYYHSIEKVNGAWKIREPLPPEMVVKQNNYFRYVVNKDGGVIFAFRIFATPMWKVEYTYKSNGALEKASNISFEVPDSIPD